MRDHVLYSVHGQSIGSLTPDAGVTNASRDSAGLQRPSDRLAAIAGNLRPPRLRRGLIERERLFPQTNRPWVLVEGPAGAGKTTLVAQWLSRLDRPSSWLSLSEEDGNLVPFIEHLVAAFRQVAPAAGTAVIDALRLSKLPSPEVLGSLLNDDLHSLSDPIVVVIDNVHEGNSIGIQRFLSPLLRYPAPRLQVVMISQSAPLPIEDLRARGALEEIGAERLSFTENESGLLLRRLSGRRVTGVALARLRAYLDGWALGLNFAGLALRNVQDPERLAEAAALNGDPENLDFLFQIVFSQLPDTVRTVLLRTSCVEVFSIPLCDALTWEPGEPVDTEGAIEWIRRRNLFFDSFGDDLEWFRYHEVFRQFLSRQLLALNGQAIVHRLLIRAADWFAQFGFAGQAVRYALAAGEPLAASGIVKRAAQETLVEGDWTSLEAWLSAIPDMTVDQDPELLVLSSWCAWLRGHDAVVARHTARARLRLADFEDLESEADGIQAELDCISACRRPFTDEPVLQAQALERAISKLPADHHFSRGQAVFRLAMSSAASGNVANALRGLHALAGQTTSSAYVAQFALSGLIWIYAFSGDILRAATATDRLLRTLEESRAGAFAIGWAYWHAGAIAYERNDLTRAAQMLEIAIAQRESLPFSAFQDSLLLLVATYQALGRPTEADALLADLLRVAESVNDFEAIERAHAYGALVAIQLGQLPNAIRWLDHTPLEPARAAPMFSQPAHLILARLLVARGTTEDLKRASLIAHLIERQFQHTVMPERQRFQLCILRSLIAERSGNNLLADAFIRETMDLVQLDGFMRTLIEFGPSTIPLLKRLPSEPTRDLLIRALQREETRPVPETADWANIAITGSVLPPAVSINPQDVLTSREQQVLDLLSQRLSNREIADELFISPLTVKRHNSNIFDKLGVSGRREAVRRAEELGFLSLDWSTADGPAL